MFRPAKPTLKVVISDLNKHKLQGLQAIEANIATQNGHHTSLYMIDGADKTAGMMVDQFRFPQISCFWIGIYGFIQVALWLRIMSVRAPKSSATHKLQNLAASSDNENLRVTRAHGNYTENAPIFAIMLLMVDLLGVIPASILDATGFVFATGRFLHATGLDTDEGDTIGRMGGALLTLLSLIAVVTQCLFSAFALSGQMCRFRFLGLAISLAISKSIAGLKPKRRKSN